MLQQNSAGVDPTDEPARTMTLRTRSFALAMLCAGPTFGAETATLAPAALKAIAIAGDAGAPTFAVQNVGASYEVRARDFASGAVRNNLVYQRFDLTPLGRVVIDSASLKFNRVAGDVLTTSRFALYGLQDIAGNLQQSWTASSFAYGAEFDPAMYRDLVASTGACPINLASVADFSTQETVSGNQATLASAAFVSFLQARTDADGQATVILGMPSQGAGNDKKMTFAYAGYADPLLPVSLVINYSAVPLPSPPDNFAVGSVSYSLAPSLTLNWEPVDGALTYHVYRRAEGEATATLVETTSDASYFDQNLVLFGSYYYSVDVVTANGQSVPSAEFKVQVIDSTLGAPPAPDGMRTTAATLIGVALAWNAVPGAIVYELYRSLESDGAYSLLQTVAATEVSDASNIKGFRSYYYRLKTIAPGGVSRYSDTFTVGPRFISGPRPHHAENLSSPARTAYSVDLVWDKSVNAQAYYVYRSTSEHAEATLVGITETNLFTDTFAVYPQNTYYYSVRAVGAAGFSHDSHETEVRPLLTNYKQVEKLGRALVAVPTPAGVLVSWRLLGTDRDEVGFRVYRDGHPLNHKPILGATNFLDTEGSVNSQYEVRTVFGFFELPGRESATMLANGYLSIPIQAPAGGVTPDGGAYTYAANDASVADLDGDGTYEVILKWDPSNSQDNANAGYTGNVFIDAYKLDGGLLWRIDLGRNIRAGAHYSPYLVYDFDGDGRAEIICKTADATVDGLGIALGDPAADYRDVAGRVLSGPEFLTLFDGLTGEALDSVDYVPQRGNVVDWGDSYGNRVDRFNAGVAYLDGIHPSAYFARGYYGGQSGMGAGITAVAAFGVKNERLVSQWIFDTRVAGSSYIGQGNHQVTAGDVDGDGKDEIFLGSLVLNDDGTALYSTGLGHGDAMHLGDLDPARPGLELFSVKEEVARSYQVAMTDAATGALLWGVVNGRDTGRGLAADIDPNYAGDEVWGASNVSVWSTQGTLIGQKRPSINFAIWWDGDPLRELLDATSIRKWDWSNEAEVVVLDAIGTAANNGSKATPCLQADLLGDWREEVVLRSADNTELRIYTTGVETHQRIPTLMHDPQYRVAIAAQNSGYNQPPQPSFFIGNNMPTVAMPKVFVSPVPDFLGVGGHRGAFATSVMVVLNVNLGESLHNEYRVDNGRWSQYHAPFLVTRQGDHVVAFRTLNANGNILAEASRALSIRYRHSGLDSHGDEDCEH